METAEAPNPFTDEAVTVETRKFKGSIKIRKTSEEEDLRTKIITEHTAAVSAIVDSVRHAAACGAALIEAREKITGTNFREWVQGFPFTYRTAYRYIKIAEGVADGALDINGATSINEALRLLAASAKDEDEKDEEKDADQRIETFVTHAMKIEAWFKKETSKEPVALWSQERKDICRRQLDGVVAIHQALE